MPRANRYYLPGHSYHLTHRCHDQEFLLRFGIDRNVYRQMLWESLQGSSAWLLSYCITGNHVHLLVRSDEPDGISTWMQLIEGRFAQYYNRRKGRSGAFWEDRYHATLVDSGEHLERCMTYIELNMVRAGVVAHPKEWRWCSYQEWTGQRSRYRLVDLDQSLEFLGGHTLPNFQKHLESRINQAIAVKDLMREAKWTEGIAVGSAAFVEQVAGMTQWRRRLEKEETSPGSWVLRENDSPYARTPM